MGDPTSTGKSEKEKIPRGRYDVARVYGPGDDPPSLLLSTVPRNSRPKDETVARPRKMKIP